MIKVTYNPNAGYACEDGKAWETVEDWIRLKDIEITVSTITPAIMLILAVKENLIRSQDMEIYGISSITKRPILIPIDKDGNPTSNLNEKDFDIPILRVIERFQELEVY